MASADMTCTSRFSVFASEVSRMGMPVVFNAFDNASGFSLCLWRNHESIDELLLRGVKAGGFAAPDAHFVFLSHAKGSRPVCLCPCVCLCPLATTRD